MRGKLQAVRSRRWVRRLGLAFAGVAATVVVLVAAANAYILLSEHGDATAELSRVPHAQAALVLGAFVEPNGHMSQMLADRVQRAVQLWRAGKVDRILVSGDNHTRSYDEPDTMRRALQAAGVPAADVFTDHAGFDTWASMVRARKIFGVRSAIVVTQGFHMPRALYLAKAAGLRASGFTADLHGYGRQGELSSLREVLARVKALYQGTAEQHVLLGPRIAITGDDRASWGPQQPTS